MDKPQVVAILEEMANLLELADASPFEILAFRNGARALEEWDGDLAAAVSARKLTQIRSVGKGLAGVISDLVQNGESEQHRTLRASFPGSLPDLLRVPGLGPKKIKALHGELGIDSLESLEQAIRDERVRTLKGFGVKTEERLLQGIDRVRRISAGEYSAGGGPRPRETRQKAPTVRERATTPARRSRPAGQRRLYAGTSGYSYPEWKGTFFPEDLRAQEFLSFYAQRFSTVEINNTFYRFPTQKVLDQWVAETPDSFVFAIKANQRITHRSRLRDVEETTVSFVERCQSIGERLGPLLFQLPPNLERDDERLSAFLDSLPTGGRYAVEFRHDSWFEDAVFDRLAAAKVALVQSEDETIAAPRLATTDFCYIRLRKGSYGKDELDDWRAWIEAQCAAGRDVFAYLKHDEAGSSPEKAIARLRGE